MTLRWLLIPCAAMPIAWFWMPLDKWNSLSQGLLFFLGLLVAAIVQIIPVTANFAQPEHLTVEETRRLNAALEKQQKFWLMLLGTSFITSIIIIIGTFIDAKENAYAIYMSKIVSASISALFSFVLIRAFEAMRGIYSLQILRSELMMLAVRRRDKEKKTSACHVINTPNVTPANYGALHSQTEHLEGE